MRGREWSADDQSAKRLRCLGLPPAWSSKVAEQACSRNAARFSSDRIRPVKSDLGGESSLLADYGAVLLKNSLITGSPIVPAITRSSVQLRFRALRSLFKPIGSSLRSK